MVITKMALPRRTFLRGLGAAVALPLLDAMVPALSATVSTAANPVKRLGFVYIPMGMNPVPWTPAAEGRLTELSPSLASLTPFLDHLTVITNLELRNANTTGNHASSNCAFLSCARAKRTESNDYELGTTVDQVVAQQVGRETRFPSLELGTDLIAQVGNCDNGYACVYQNNLSWSSPTTPLPTEADPRAVFERLFGDGGTPEERRVELRKNASILDWVMKDMAGLRAKLGAGDRTKVNEYLDTVREVERRIQLAERQNSETPLPELERPASVPASWEDHVKLMCDLQVLALQADLTRVISFQLAREASTRTYPQIGVPEPHHPVSHHTNDPEKLAKLAKINAYHVSLFGYLLGRLHNTADGDGSLLDHTTYLLGSGMGNPDIHDHQNLPIVVARGGATRSGGGRHIKYKELVPLANLHLALMDHLGVHLDSFVDSTGRVDGVFEPISL
jgi:Protein of unknown function (DUF1552)